LFGEQSGTRVQGASTFHRPHFNRFQKDTPALAAPLDRASKTGDFCDAKITTPEGNLQLKSAKNRLFY
jgi:hypothetical protein